LAAQERLAPFACASGGDRAWLNIKSAIAGIERREYEYAIPIS
jgi:CYTH domain-containing protein